MAEEKEEKERKSRKHFDFVEIEEYLRSRTYPTTISLKDFGSKSNFRRDAKKYEVKDGHLYYGKRLFVKERNRQIEIISDIHKVTGESEHSKAMASHKCKNSTYEKVAQRFFWHSIANDVNDFIRSCDQCQKQGDLKSPKT